MPVGESPATGRKGERCFAAREWILQTLAVDDALLRAVRARFPLQWPQYYLDLVGTKPESDPIARMGRPTLAELLANPGDLNDPVADLSLRPIPFLVRKYADRVILLATKRCHFYCRFCFRRAEPATAAGEPGAADWERIFAYLEAHPEIEEPILSGGDPLTLTDKQLFRIRDRLAAIASVRRWRIHSRAPVHFPRRVTPALVGGLAAGPPLVLVTHFNHARELTAESERVARTVLEHGIALKNQAVLLRGVNDKAEAQTALWAGLAKLGCRPHYLHHPDRAPGNAAFRLNIAKGLAIYQGLRAQLPSTPPRYVLDLPDGRGKVAVEDLKRTGPSRYVYRHPDGTLSTYADIDP